MKGSLWSATTNQKLSPRAGKVDTNECEWPKGEQLGVAKLFYYSPSVSPTARQLPRKRWSLLGCTIQAFILSLPCRGRWMRAKRADGGVAAWLLLFTSTPQSIRLAAYCQLPGRGVFGRYTQTLVQYRRAANDGPYSTSYKPLAKTRGRTASPISSQSLTLTRRKADFTLRKQYFTARQRNFTRSQERISPRAEARYISHSSASSYSL